MYYIIRVPYITMLHFLIHHNCLPISKCYDMMPHLLMNLTHGLLVFHCYVYAGLLQVVPQLYMEDCDSSYHFLHKTVQEFMAALHLFSLTPAKRPSEFVRAFIRRGNMTMVVRFMAGLTKLQSQEEGECIQALLEEGEEGTRKPPLFI